MKKQETTMYNDTKIGFDISINLCLNYPIRGHLSQTKYDIKAMIRTSSTQWNGQKVTG